MRILMRAAAVVITIAVVVSAGTADPAAQNDRPNPQATRQTPPPVVAPPPVYRVNEAPDVTAAKRDQQNAFTCTVPDSDARFNVNSVMTYRGQSYRCVEVYSPNKPSRGAATLQFSGMGWIKEGGAPAK